MNQEAKELSECLDVMPKDIKELQKMAYNVILDSNQQLLERLSEKGEKTKRKKEITLKEYTCKKCGYDFDYDYDCECHYNEAIDDFLALIQEEKANL